MTKENRTEQYHLRLSPSERDLLERGAAAEGRSLASLLRAAGLRHAREALDEQERRSR